MTEINLETMSLLELKALNVRIQREVNRRRYIELERRISRSDSLGLKFELGCLKSCLKTSVYYPDIKSEDLCKFLDNLEAKADAILERVEHE